MESWNSFISFSRLSGAEWRQTIPTLRRSVGHRFLNVVTVCKNVTTFLRWTLEGDVMPDFSR